MRASGSADDNVGDDLLGLPQAYDKPTPLEDKTRPGEQCDNEVQSLTSSMQGVALVDVYRHVNIGNRGPAVASAARRLGAASWPSAPYAYSQLLVLATAALTPGVVNPALLDAFGAYLMSGDFESRHMICSELVARAFNRVDPSLQPSVRMWPTMGLLGDLSNDFRMDFTTPNMLALSPSLVNLHHVW